MATRPGSQGPGGTTDQPTLRRLAGALNLLLGVEAMVALTDIARLDRDEALDVLTWTAQTLVSAAAEAGSGSRSPVL